MSDQPAPCLQQQELIDKVQEHLMRISELTRATAEALANGIRGFWMYYEEFLPKIREALTEATQVVASGRLSLPITATYKPFQIKVSITSVAARFSWISLARTRACSHY
jgi:hypothetical protein